MGIGRAYVSAMLAYIRSCPMSVVDKSVRAGKPKWRLTTDLSWPHVGAMIEGGIEVDAVNQAKDRSDWPANRTMRVIELAEAAGYISSKRYTLVLEHVRLHYLSASFISFDDNHLFSVTLCDPFRTTGCLIF